MRLSCNNFGEYILLKNFLLYNTLLFSLFKMLLLDTTVIVMSW